MTDWCPQCVGVRKDRYSPLESTIRYRRKDGYKFCYVCGRRWPVKKETKENGTAEKNGDERLPAL